MTEIIIDENKNKQNESNNILPEIKIKQNNQQLKENINQKEETNSSIAFQVSKESERPISEKLFETENTKRNDDKEIKENEKPEPDLNKIKNQKNNKTIENMNSLDNKLYFTETNIQSNPHKNTTEKSSSSKLYTIEVIPEHPIDSKLNSKILSSNKSTKSKDKNNSNILQPEVELKRRIVNKFNFYPLQHRIKEIEEQIKKQNEYDFEKTMKELKIKYEQKLKKKERDKIINEKNEKFKNKLKQMEEFRNNIINQKLIKVMQKQNRPNKRNKIRNKSFELSPNEKTENNKSLQKNHYTIDINYSEKDEIPFPSIQNLSRLEYVKLKKQKTEEEFCFQVQQKLQENEEIHKRNYLNHLNSVNRKRLRQEKLYRERSYNCFERIKLKDEELKENFIKKEMVKSYNINKIISRARYNKKVRLNKIQFKNYNVKENQELIEKNMEKKISDYKKKLTEQNKILNKKKMNLSYYNTEKMQKKIIFSDKQKENLKNLNKEMSSYYNDLIMKHEDNVMIVNDIQKQENIMRAKVVKRTIGEQIKKEHEIENLTKFRGRMKNENIYNLSEDKVKKIFNKRQIEERKKMESETDIYNS